MGHYAPRCRRCLPRTQGSDAVEEDARRLVGRVLRDELAAEDALGDGAAKRPLESRSFSASGQNDVDARVRADGGSTGESSRSSVRT